MATILSNIAWGDMFSMALRILAVLLCIVFHELSHGFAAYLLGDPTAKRMHRLSLNPIRHIDPFGAIMMVAVGFGWAKPVPINPGYFKNPKSGMAITALAGPLSNFIMAFLGTALYQFSIGRYYGGGSVSTYWLDFLAMFILLNIGLGIFNLIPFPPLDGSKVLGAVLPERLYFGFMRYEKYGIIILMAALWLGYLDAPLYFFRQGILDICLGATEWIYKLALYL